MSRRRFLVAYDIADPKRLRQVHRTMKGYGWSMQYSVFVCDLDSVEYLRLRMEISDVIHHDQDAVAMIDLGNPTERGRSCFAFLGVAPSLPTGGPVIL